MILKRFLLLCLTDIAGGLRSAHFSGSMNCFSSRGLHIQGIA